MSERLASAQYQLKDDLDCARKALEIGNVRAAKDFLLDAYPFEHGLRGGIIPRLERSKTRLELKLGIRKESQRI